jgi:hypothetical protein
VCRRSSNAYAHHLDFQYNNFGDIFSIVQKRPLLCICSPFGFSIQQFWRYLFYCPKTAFVMHMLTIWIFNTTILEMSFLLSKSGLCWWISAYPIVENIFFLNVPHFLWIWDFVDTYVTYLETRIKWCIIHAYLKKLFFWPPKLCCPPLAQGNKNFFMKFKLYDLANGKEWVCEIWQTCRQTS